MDSAKIIINGQEADLGGQTLAVDETLNMDDAGILSVVNPNRCVTKAQFDRMSQEEKRGTVIVTDEDPYLVHHPGEVYSTKEMVIGRWIDGRSVYRKVFTGTINVINNNVIVGYIENLKDLINITGTIYETDHQIYVVSDPATFLKYDTVSHAVFIYATRSGQLNQPYMIIVEYTKTIDDLAASAVTLESKIPMQKSGSITIDDQNYHYEMPDVDVIASASASAVASASSATFHF